MITSLYSSSHIFIPTNTGICPDVLLHQTMPRPSKFLRHDTCVYTSSDALYQEMTPPSTRALYKLVKYYG